MKITYDNVLSHYKDEIELNDLAHDLNHVINVYLKMVDIDKVLDLGVDKKMILLAAFLHDLKCHVDRKKHCLLSANYVTDCWYTNDCKDPFIKQLTEEEAIVLSDAIIKHRASGNEIPEEGLAGLLYASDKDAPILKDIVLRSYRYDNNCERVLNHMQEKFSSEGYLKYNNYYKRYYGSTAINEIHNEINDLTIEKIRDIVTS